MSRSQAEPRGPAVTEGGKRLRIMYAGSDQQTVRHTWRPDTQRGLQLVTERKDSRAKGGWVLGSKVYVAAFESALSKMAKEKAHEVMHAKRETARRNGVPQKRQSGADTSMSCTVLATIAASQPNATTRTMDSRKGPSATRLRRNQEVPDVVTRIGRRRGQWTRGGCRERGSP